MTEKQKQKPNQKQQNGSTEIEPKVEPHLQNALKMIYLSAIDISRVVYAEIFTRMQCCKLLVAFFSQGLGQFEAYLDLFTCKYIKCFLKFSSVGGVTALKTLKLICMCFSNPLKFGAYEKIISR